MLSRIRSLLLGLAVRLYRTPAESVAETRDSTAPLKIAVMVIAAAGLIAVIGIRFATIFNQWNRFEPSVALDPAGFRMLLDPPAVDCGDRATDSANCPADPANPLLWTSPVMRDDPYEATRNPAAKPRPYKADHFWVGVDIDTATLARAAEFGAHTLVLGWVNSPYRVWFQGRVVCEGDGGKRTQPIVIPFSRDRLTRGEPIRVAIRADVDPTRLVIDAFSRDRMGRDLGPAGVGLFTDAEAEAYRGLVSFWGNTRPTALALAYLLLAGVFFLFWLPAKRKREYYYMALYTLVSAAFQAHRLDWIQFELPGPLSARIELILLYWSPAFGCFAGLAFARVRRTVFKYAVPVAFVFPLLLAAAPPGPLQELFKLLSIRFIVPAVGVVVAVACLLQAYLLRDRARGGSRNPVRIRRLLLFAAANFALSVFYYFEFADLAQGPMRLYWLGLEHFGLALFLALIVLSEYGESERLVSQTPVSPYHKRPVLPEAVSGTLLVLDLKGSEALFRYGAAIGEGAALVESCLSQLWNCVVARGGIILQTEGDAIRAFFDDDAMTSSLASALAATDDAARALASMTEGLISRELMPPDAPALCFRAGVAQGKIRPVWHEMGPTRYASWMEAGTSNAFVDSTRYMDLERKLPAHSGSYVILAEALAAKLEGEDPVVASRLVSRKVALHGKHDVAYLCAVYAAATGAAGPAIATARRETA